MKYAVVDLETSVKNKGEGSVGDMPASPFHLDNQVVLYGIMDDIRGQQVYAGWHLEAFDTINNAAMLVGANIKFDLLYLLQHDYFRTFTWPHIKVWDVQLVHYLLSGQTEKFPSLDAMAEHYGLPLKPNKIKEYWEAGVETEDIPRNELIEYLKHDLLVTKQIFLKQMQEVHDLGMTELVSTQMDGLMATCEMEWNGMSFDKDTAIKYAFKLGEHITMLERDVYRLLPSVPGHVWNVNSTQQIATALFGGEVTVDVEQNAVDETGRPIYYKSGAKKGLMKTRKVKVSVPVAGYLDGNVYSERNAKGWKVDDEVLKKIVHKAPPGPVIDLAEKLLTLRDLSKQMSTYFVGFSDLTWHDGKIHPNYQHTATATGRLSCAKPNLQNVTRAEE